MRSTLKPQTYTDFGGGLNATAAPYLLEVSQARDCLNMRATPTGSIRKRNGFTTLSDSTLYDATRTLGGVHTLFPSNAATKSLLAVGTIESGASDSIVKVTTGGVASNLKTGQASDKPWYFAQAEVSGASGPVFGMNGTNTPQRWDGSAASTSDWVAGTGSVPVGKYLTYFSSRLWCAGVSATPSRLFFSGITGVSPDPLVWDADGFVDLEPNDGQPITAIGVQGPNLLVFKPRKIYVIYDPVTGANRKLANDLGCVAHRSVIDTPIGMVFLTEDQGVCVTNGSTVENISVNVRPVFDAVQGRPTAQPDCAGIYFQNSYYLSLPYTDTFNTHTLEYNLQSRSWWLHDCASNQFALVDPGGTPVLYSASPDTGTNTAHIDKAFVDDVFQDNAANYAGTTYYTSAFYVWGMPHVQKRLREVRVDGTGVWETQMTTDFNDVFAALEGETWASLEDLGGTYGEATTDFGGTGTFGPPTAAYSERRYYTPGPGRSFSVKFINDNDKDFEIDSATFALTPRTD